MKHLIDRLIKSIYHFWFEITVKCTMNDYFTFALNYIFALTFKQNKKWMQSCLFSVNYFFDHTHLDTLVFRFWQLIPQCTTWIFFIKKPLCLIVQMLLKLKLKKKFIQKRKQTKSRPISTQYTYQLINLCEWWWIEFDQK